MHTLICMNKQNMNTHSYNHHRTHKLFVFLLLCVSAVLSSRGFTGPVKTTQLCPQILGSTATTTLLPVRVCVLHSGSVSDLNASLCVF